MRPRSFRLTAKGRAGSLARPPRSPPPYTDRALEEAGPAVRVAGQEALFRSPWERWWTWIELSGRLFSFFPSASDSHLPEIRLSSPDKIGLPDLRENPSFQEPPRPMRRTSRSALPAPRTPSGLGHQGTEVARRFSAFTRGGSKGPCWGTRRGSRRLPPR